VLFFVWFTPRLVCARIPFRALFFFALISARALRVETTEFQGEFKKIKRGGFFCSFDEKRQIKKSIAPALLLI
jgi:hypothetical protein